MHVCTCLLLPVAPFALFCSERVEMCALYLLLELEFYVVSSVGILSAGV